MESLESKYKKLEELKNNTSVKLYFDLLEEIKNLENQNIEFDSCDHDIWVYEGSYYFLQDLWHGSHYYFKTNSEKNDAFSHNTYICLNCNSKIDIDEWKKFEKTHIVLKNQNKDIDINYYKSLYNQLILIYGNELAKEKLIEEFNKENNSSKKLIKK